MFFLKETKLTEKFPSAIFGQATIAITIDIGDNEVLN